MTSMFSRSDVDVTHNVRKKLHDMIPRREMSYTNGIQKIKFRTRSLNLIGVSNYRLLVNEWKYSVKTEFFN